MKLFCILLTAILCASASAQTIKTLGFNSTNGQVVANTGTNVLTFTNDVRFASGDLQVSGTQISGAVLLVDFDDGAISGPITINTNSSVDFLGSSAATTRANLGFSTNLNTLWTATNASNARSAVGLGATWLTNTSVTNFRTAIGLGEANSPQFQSLKITNNGSFIDVTSYGIIGYDAEIDLEEKDLSAGSGYDWNLGGSGLSASGSITFSNTTNAAITRTNLGLPLAALTNTSNVTMMRTLSGSTNTNHPFSGSISVTGTNNTNTLVFSNGILQSVQ